MTVNKMPNNEEHAQHSYQRYGLYAEDLHQWMDEPSRLYGPSHRWVRHQNNDVRNPPQIYVDEYGLERTRDVMMDHILLDGRGSKRTNARANSHLEGIASPPMTLKLMISYIIIGGGIGGVFGGGSSIEFGAILGMIAASAIFGFTYLLIHSDAVQAGGGWKEFAHELWTRDLPWHTKEIE